MIGLLQYGYVDNFHAGVPPPWRRSSIGSYHLHWSVARPPTADLAAVRVDVVVPLVAEALRTMLVGHLQLQTSPSNQQMPRAAQPVTRKGSRRTPGSQLRETSRYRRQQASQQGAIAPTGGPVWNTGGPVLRRCGIRWSSSTHENLKCLRRYGIRRSSTHTLQVVMRWHVSLAQPLPP